MTRVLGKISALLGLLLLIAPLLGCRSAYYAAWEKFGKHKRDLLKQNVQAARQEQQEAAEQFKDALTQIRELYRFEGGDIEKVYDRLKSEFDQSTAKAEAVKSRIGKVEQIAADLFREWEQESKQITNPRLAADSRQKLRSTQRRYQDLHAAMKRAEKSLDPVLTQFRDQVLYLKHNLNAQAIGALRGEAVDIEREIEQLLDEMNRSIAEADAFIKTLP